ncbi:von Willebrand factor type A domain protein [Pseudomonas phage VCM]|uniref:von Willebrand factor type A domain protein n=1 Tax=Pseudomonas phage VCM TaxID=1729937 RepID=A0A0S4KWG8_9CAUD|nr:von Willebrand factor type A domain protein [Pseudomonas phage VCM]CUR44373.1 von Willebrand factor type A domain protein [Pseudomonas phage VCM]
MGMPMLDLTKALELNLEKAQIFTPITMAVKLAVDKSGSMSDEFASGWVQDTLDLFLAAAMKFDDDGVMEIGFFNTSFDRTPDMTVDDAHTYIRDNRIYAGGGTNFADAIKGLKGKNKGGFFSFGKKPTPVYLALITDGENNDKREFEAQLDSLENTFVQIVAIGNGCNKRYLDAVAAKYDTVEVLYLPNPKAVDQNKFYELLLNEEFKAFAVK